MKKSYKILINASNISSGGGLTILERCYAESDKQYIYIVKSQSISDRLKECHKLGPDVIVLPVLFQVPVLNFLFHLVGFYILAKYLRVKKVVSLGNIASCVPVKQIVYIQWAYFPFGVFYLNKSLNKGSIIRLLRYLKIRFFIKQAELIVVQTETIKKQMLKRFGFLSCDSIKVVYPGRQSINMNEFTYEDLLAKPKKKLLYPALYYSHKNFEILPHLDTTFEELDMVLYVTLTDNQFASLGLEKCSSIKNIGVVDSDKLLSIFCKIDVLFMPTKFETVGLPYIEALTLGKQILTSDAAFSREICGEAANYFDPSDIRSIQKALKCLNISEQKNSKLSEAALEKFKPWNISFHDMVDEDIK
ncbi:glycosyltransferase [Pseudoalteromonas sp. CO348]|uniref:glycosyltransferase n=1 Tax=Pseudoalteromonas sp. CO348 TaxID=1777271 RepID=UPI001022F6D0|nr:glycosyltransferase [Pseudoalteromonas sp. CO348]RZG03147.1 glycosyltransferase [Pseudoalteromonas sp. CO348]